ncbi:MAG: hypothetical protein WDA27_12945 [Actinomycetota bacterium]
MNATFDPVDPKLLLFEVAWVALSAGLFFAAMRSRSEWVKATLAGLAISILGIRLLAVLPSWWLYFADGRLGWGGQGCTAINPATSEGLSCLKQSAKDLVVVVQNGIVLAGFGAAFVIYQRRLPKQLRSGESKAESTGGYK